MTEPLLKGLNILVLESVYSQSGSHAGNALGLAVSSSRLFSFLYSFVAPSIPDARACIHTHTHTHHSLITHTGNDTYKEIYNMHTYKHNKQASKQRFHSTYMCAYIYMRVEKEGAGAGEEEAVRKRARERETRAHTHTRTRARTYTHTS